MAAPIHCHECGRPNSAAAPRCIYCGVTISAENTQHQFDAINLELEYLSGIERLEDPMPVRVIVSSEGVEIREVMPGTRTMKIAASALLEAQAIDASTTVNETIKRSWWQVLITPLSTLRQHQLRAKKQHDYFLTIQYREADEIRNAVFHREDRAAQAMVESVARSIAALVQRKDK